MSMSDPIYSYSAQEYAFAVFLNFLAAIGFVLDSLIIFAFLKKRNITVSSKFILSFCCADMFLTAIILIFGIRDVIAGGYSWGSLACVVESQILVFSEGSSIMFLIAITLDRYLVIKHQYSLSHRQAHIIIFAIMIGMPFVGLPLIVGGADKHSISLQPGKLICAITWWDPSSTTVFAVYVSLVFVTTCSITMIYAYSSVIFLYKEVHSSANAAAQSKMFSTAKDEMSSSSSKENSIAIAQAKATERLILTKCIALTGCFMVSWIPFVINVFVQQVTRRPSSSLVDNFILILVGLNTIMNSVMLLKFDLRVRSTVFGVLGIKERTVRENGHTNMANMANLKPKQPPQANKNNDSFLVENE